MKKNFSLSIPQPCAEKWGNFTPTTQGGYCSSCSKVVVDFTKMGDAEILDFFASRPAHTCGRFRPDQMKSYVASVPLIKINPGMTLLKAGFMSLLFLLISKQTSAQEALTSAKTEMVQDPNQATEKSVASVSDRVIRGVVIGEDDKLPIAGVNVVIKNTTQGTSTDIDGKFELYADFKEGDVLVFSFIGYNQQKYVVRKGTGEIIEIQMMMDMTVLGEVAVAGVYEEPSGFQKLWSKVKGLF